MNLRPQVKTEVPFDPPPPTGETNPTSFFGDDGQDVAGGARAHAVGGEHAQVVGPGRTQVHQGQLGQLWVRDLGDDRGVPGG